MEAFWLHGIVIGIAVPVALYFFYKALRFKYRLLKACAPVPDPIEFNQRRFKDLLTIFLGQKKIFQDASAGFMHALIFWGFLILTLRGLTLFFMAFAGFDFSLPLLHPGTFTGNIYSLLKDLANLWVLCMVVYAMIRRYVLRIPRLLNTPGALFVLLMIMTLMVSDILFDSIYHASQGAGFQMWSPVSTSVASFFYTSHGVSTAASFLGHLAYFIHTIGILVFLVYLPAGKHMHIITAVFNVFLHPLDRTGRLTKLDLEDEEIESFGVNRIEELTWKDVLDLYTCTECGRCNDVCPANRTRKPLAPRELTTEQKHFLVDEEADRILAGDPEVEPKKELVPDVVLPDEIWSCTTCGACEQACPVNIGYVQRINDLRRSEVLMKAAFPTELKRVFKGLENNSNPWGIGSSKRLEWAKDLDLPRYEENQDAEYLLFFGCAACYDDRAQHVSRSLVGLLKKMNISFGVIGEDEQCCGETARRLGEEALGQMLIETNVELFNELGVKKILTLCPHCFNTFKREYPDFGGKYEVVHYTQLFADLVKQGRLDLGGIGSRRIVWHDSCYLGRLNEVFDEPRTILGSIPGVEVAEPRETREFSFCCGGGGGMFWMEEMGERINNERFRQLSLTQPDVIATACPYCLKMLDDASKDLAEENVIPVKDILELIESSINSKEEKQS